MKWYIKNHDATRNSSNTKPAGAFKFNSTKIQKLNVNKVKLEDFGKSRQTKLTMIEGKLKIIE